ncbi:MAG: hypothetical protein HN736_01935 [Anaerolineae bacterium]|nr:hypothetical protein [Anaerolineae bacterium]MBT4309454.1 hypothetical protein [Anaerolineae bacterium]MBT4458270.1 hypothetical protein [Anaerolineae bacterium]MBT4840975.1 hypothetical protein [Anaerolineae bacterium]MBT6061151.1 hypothetical protein [Anaerolineae bacterium]
MKKKLLPFAIIALVFIVVLGILLAANYAITPRLSGGEDFLVPWMGARAFLFEQSNPYTSEFSRETQVEIYGYPAEEGEYPYRLDIPFYLLVFYFPFALIENFDLARALWMSFAEIALFVVGLLSIYLAEWKVSRLNLALFFATLFFSFYGLYPLLEGGWAIFTALTLLLSLIAFREKQDEILGILLLFGTIHFQSGGLLFFFLLFLLITSRRWKTFSISLMVLISALGATLIFFPDWPLPFASSLLANLRIGHGLLLSESLQIWRPDDGALIANLLRWGALLILLLEWRAARGHNFQRILWVASLSLALTPFLGIRITPAIFTILFLPLVLIFKIAEDRWRYANIGISIFFLFLLSTWAIFLNMPNALEALTFAFPFLLFLALYWLRWWLVRPPRTWADRL